MSKNGSLVFDNWWLWGDILKHAPIDNSIRDLAQPHEYAAIEGFCGPGGMSLGLHQSGFAVRLAFNNDAFAEVLLEKTHGSRHVDHIRPPLLLIPLRLADTRQDRPHQPQARVKICNPVHVAYDGVHDAVVQVHPTSREASTGGIGDRLSRS